MLPNVINVFKHSFSDRTCGSLTMMKLPTTIFSGSSSTHIANNSFAGLSNHQRGSGISLTTEKPSTAKPTASRTERCKPTELLHLLCCWDDFSVVFFINNRPIDLTAINVFRTIGARRVQFDLRIMPQSHQVTHQRSFVWV